MKLVTWNVNSLKARLPRVLELLARHHPDVVCLQETKLEDAAFPVAELAAAGYRAVHHSAGRWAGVALLARQGLELEDPARGLAGELAAGEARWIEATVAGRRMACTYVPNGRAVGSPSFEQKLAFLDAMHGRAGARNAPGARGDALDAPGGALDAILGDFNVAPCDLDVYDPTAFVGSTHVSTDERARLAAVCSLGFVDAYRALHPDEIGYTWWDYRQGHFHRGMGLRIDLALLRDGLAGTLRECGIDRDFRKGPKPSDHAPLLVELAD